ncbi:ATP phosphoribosyltransferase regulatory subunit [Calothrix sp. NIES-3974]|uniref:ATP phosphoribosyltransferase regulatory subunit n=1 Tax=Calothrix sp. NIES-3974 TaxID=2005462 RepID=UPI000B5DBC74|nr:ATP phosphoribosyltransferase regulatory subunit [Calothrix sp. NIES-3974]BAZ07084.1 putative histidyl-tRNA synthetase 2 [Calothrix sp. NIES-3974]
MVYQPATGARDLLPLDVAQKRWIEERLQLVFHRWGYHRIITSTLERMDTLMAGGAIQRRTVIQLQNGEDEDLGLRPELTASIARTAVTRMGTTKYPQRLYYNANVFQRTRESRHNRQQEFYQAGVELLGGGGLIANGEILTLVADCLQGLDVPDWSLVLGEAGITQSLLTAFPAQLQPQIRHAIANLDRVAVETLPLGDELRDRALTIIDLRGQPEDVLSKLQTLVTTPEQLTAINNLQALLDLLNANHQFPIVLDLSLIQTFDYYTGIVFEVVSQANNQVRVIGRGGRYDTLLSHYHPQGENIPGIGFVFLIDDLYEVLTASQQLPQTLPVTNWLVAPQTANAYAAAFNYAAKLRNSDHLVRVEIDFGDRNPDGVREYARSRQITQIVWIEDDGNPVLETVG